MDCFKKLQKNHPFTQSFITKEEVIKTFKLKTDENGEILKISSETYNNGCQFEEGKVIDFIESTEKMIQDFINDFERSSDEFPKNKLTRIYKFLCNEQDFYQFIQLPKLTKQLLKYSKEYICIYLGDESLIEGLFSSKIMLFSENGTTWTPFLSW